MQRRYDLLLTKRTVKIAGWVSRTSVFESGFSIKRPCSFFEHKSGISSIYRWIGCIDKILFERHFDSSQSIHYFFKSLKIDIHILSDGFSGNFSNLACESLHGFVLSFPSRQSEIINSINSSWFLVKIIVWDIEITRKRKHRNSFLLIINSHKDNRVGQIWSIMITPTTTSEEDIFDRVFFSYETSSISEKSSTSCNLKIEIPHCRDDKYSEEKNSSSRYQCHESEEKRRGLLFYFFLLKKHVNIVKKMCGHSIRISPVFAKNIT